MTINLSEELQAFVGERIASGQYKSVDEIIEAALLELKNIETAELDARWLKAKLNTGVASLDIDGGLSPEEVKEKLRRYREHHAAKVKA